MCFYECGDRIPNCGLDPDDKYEHLTVDFPCPFHEGRYGNRYTVFEIREKTLEFLRELHDLDSADEEAAEEQVYRSALESQYKDNDNGHSEDEDLSPKSGKISPDYFLEMSQNIAAQDKAPASKRSQRTKETDRAHDWLPAKSRKKVTKNQVAARLAKKGAAPGWTRPTQPRPVVADPKSASTSRSPLSPYATSGPQPLPSYHQRMEHVADKFAGARLRSPDGPYFQHRRPMSSEYFSDESMPSTSTGMGTGMATGSASDRYSTSHYDDYDDDEEEISTTTSPSTRSGVSGSTAATGRQRRPPVPGEGGDARPQRSNSHVRVRGSKRDSFYTARTCGDQKCREESRDRVAGSAARPASIARPDQSRPQGRSRK